MPSGSGNFGLKFYPTANGTVNKLGCRMPEAGTYTVTLWDFATAASLAQANVTITTPLQFVYGAVAATAVTKDKRYVVSVNNTSGGAAKKYFQLYKKPTTAINIYPFTNGKVTFEEPLYKSGAAPAMPDYNNASDFPFIRGVADIDISF